jgi:hypothetical protein
MSQGIAMPRSISQIHPHLQNLWAIAGDEYKKAVGVEEYSHRFFFKSAF